MEVQASAGALRRPVNSSPSSRDSSGEASGTVPGATLRPQEDAMHSTLRTFAVAATLVAALTAAYPPATNAGGMSATLQGPAKDGTYNLVTYSCSGVESMRPAGWAEGVVNGERRTLPLVLQPVKTPGSYVFRRTWPQEGEWLVRLTFANHPTPPALVARIGHDGRVTDIKFLWDTDGKRECDTRLAAATK
jgi:hypothetical protein